MRYKNMSFLKNDISLDIGLFLGTEADRDFLIMSRDMKVKK